MKRSSTPARLTVGIDQVADLRQLTHSEDPDPVLAARAAIDGGADGLAIRFFNDRRTLQDSELIAFSQIREASVTVRISPSDDLADAVATALPKICCLVPEQRHQFSTGGGLDVRTQLQPVRHIADRISRAGIVVAAVVDPDRRQIDSCAEAGLESVQLNTGTYALASREDAVTRCLKKLDEIAEYAAAQGLHVSAGGGLNFQNAKAVANIERIADLHVGHAIIAMAVFDGIANVVRSMKALISEASPI